MVGALQVLSHFGFWWLTTATVNAVGLAFIAEVYFGFSVAGGRPRVIVVEAPWPASSPWSLLQG